MSKFMKKICAVITMTVLTASLLTGFNFMAASKPDTSKAVVLKMVLLGDKPTDFDKVYAEVNKKLKKDINATIVTTFLSWSDWNTKYPLMFASGEDFDLIYTSSWAFYAQQATKGAFLELTDKLLTKYAPKTFMSVTKDQWIQTKIKNKVYMVPFTNKEFSKSVYLIRGDLRKKYNVPEIKNMTDMAKYWDAIAANEKAMLPIGISGNNNGEQGFWVYTTFTKAPINANTNSDIKDGTTYRTYDLSNPQKISVVDTNKIEIDDFKTMQSYQKKGYWSKNALTQTEDDLTLFQNGKSASAIRLLGNINIIYMSVKASHPDWQPEIIDVTPNAFATANSVLNNGMGIHATSKNPDRALMALDLFRNDRAYFDLTTYGIQGVHWTATPNNGYKVVGTQTTFTADSACPWGWRTPLYRNPADAAPNFASILANFNKKAITPKLSMFNFDDSNFKTEVAAVKQVKSKYDAILNLGFAENVEATVKQRNQELKAAGIDKLRAEYLKQAQTFMNSYGK